MTDCEGHYLCCCSAAAVDIAVDIAVAVAVAIAAMLLLLPPLAPLTRCTAGAEDF